MTTPLLCAEISLAAPDDDVEEQVEAALWTVDTVVGVERQDDSTFSTLVEDPRPRPAGSVRWRVYLPQSVGDASVAAIVEAIGDLAEVTTWVLDDVSYATEWRRFFRPTRVSERVWIHPPWEVPEIESGVRVQIEPGMAFGTGTHETTRLCIAAIDRRLDDPAQSVLDVGCGSGVLAITAAKLGARRVVAIDNDPDSVAIARENAALNEVDVDVSSTPIDAIEESFDLVVANILPDTLIAMSDALRRVTRIGGALVLSGILNTQVERVERHFAKYRLLSVGRTTDGDWCSTTLVFVL